LAWHSESGAGERTGDLQVPRAKPHQLQLRQCPANLIAHLVGHLPNVAKRLADLSKLRPLAISGHIELRME